ncbi:MAG: hypothetical protein KDA38_07500 [Planctomycetales bacterium]|nr:hypothetical protein [Planctomycetales bacterium]
MLNLPSDTAVIVIDHGSRRAESNRLLESVADMFAEAASCPIVEPAHMELAEPSLATAFAECVRRGAKRIVIFPYFLAPGRHWNEDIPRLAAEAARSHPGVTYLVTAPIGLHTLMAEIMQQRIEHCWEQATGANDRCDICQSNNGCRFR